MFNAWTKITQLMMAIFIAIVLSACSSGKGDLESNLGIDGAPDWVNEGSKAVSDEDGRFIFGLGMSSSLNNMSLQKSTADARARAELARILSSFMNASLKDYASHNGDIGTTNIEKSIDSISRTSLNGSKIIARWKDKETGDIYSFAELDLNKVEQVIEISKMMNIEYKDNLEKTMDTQFDRFVKKPSSTEAE